MAKDLKTYLTNRRTRLPKPMEPEQAAEQIARLHKENGGATFSLFFGSMNGRQFYAVAIYPEPQSAYVVFGRDIDLQELEIFLQVNRSLLNDPRLCVGSWYDAEENVTYLDVVALLSEREEAIALGREYNQIAICDLSTLEVLYTGGTGEWKAIDVPPNQRLPKLAR